MGRHKSRRPAVYRTSRARALHVVGSSRAKETVAMGRAGWNLRANCGIVCLRRDDAEALSIANLRIVPGLPAWDRRRIRRIAYARGNQ